MKKSKLVMGLVGTVSVVTIGGAVAAYNSYDANFQKVEREKKALEQQVEELQQKPSDTPVPTVEPTIAPSPTIIYVPPTVAPTQPEQQEDRNIEQIVQEEIEKIEEEEKKNLPRPTDLPTNEQKEDKSVRPATPEPTVLEHNNT